MFKFFQNIFQISKNIFISFIFTRTIPKIVGKKLQLSLKIICKYILVAAVTYKKEII
jgi:hypothetical protein